MVVLVNPRVIRSSYNPDGLCSCKRRVDYPDWRHIHESAPRIGQAQARAQDLHSVHPPRRYRPAVCYNRPAGSHKQLTSRSGGNHQHLRLLVIPDTIAFRLTPRVARTRCQERCGLSQGHLATSASSRSSRHRGSGPPLPARPTLSLSMSTLWQGWRTVWCVAGADGSILFSFPSQSPGRGLHCLLYRQCRTSARVYCSEAAAPQRQEAFGLYQGQGVA
jgi:hypothetical protein